MLEIAVKSVGASKSEKLEIKTYILRTPCQVYQSLAALEIAVNTSPQARGAASKFNRRT